MYRWHQRHENMEGDMHPYVYVIQTSTDDGATWKNITADTDTEGYTDPGKLASDILDSRYRDALEGEGTQPVPLIQVHVYSGPAISAPAIATSTIGSDRQWKETGRLLTEIAAELRDFEDEKKKAEAQILSTQTAIGNARARLENVTQSAARMGMPQVDIAHATGRSREWVRKVSGVAQESTEGQKAALKEAIRAAGGTWNTRRAATALTEVGHLVTDKRTRQILRDLAATGIITKTDPSTATYRYTEQ
ncbi:hypothetical protein [Streptomyces sp. NPDC046631]|uniref:hypothetical protein n=1 Tax=unclassified Streptomyces TaxID=2593676 RepID=UPI0033FD4E17